MQYILPGDEYGTETIATEVLRLSPSHLGFLALVVCPRLEAPLGFELTFHSTAGVAQLRESTQPFPQLPFAQALEAAMPAGSGGPPSSFTFLLNAPLLLSIGGAGRGLLLAELLPGSDAVPVALTLVATAQRGLLELRPGELKAAQSSAAFLTELNALLVSVQPQKYLLVPTSLARLAQAVPCRVRLQCSLPLSAERLPAPAFPLALSLRAQAAEAAVFPFRVLRATRVVVAVTPTPAAQVELLLADGAGQPLHRAHSTPDSAYLLVQLELAAAATRLSIGLRAAPAAALDIALLAAAPDSLILQ